MQYVPHGHPRAVRRVGERRIELIFLSTMERDEVYEQLVVDLEVQQPEPEGES